MEASETALRMAFLMCLISLFCPAQQIDSSRNPSMPANTIHTRPAQCADTSSFILLNSKEEKDDWIIASGPSIPGVSYPVPANHTKPFSSWEMDRYSADSSYFSNCDWMILPNKKTVINMSTRLPVVFTKKFKTIAPSKLNLLVKMLYDNMAFLYIDSTRISLNHNNADVDRYIKKLTPEFSGFVAIPATFNFSYNASFYAGDFYSQTLPAGDHVIKIELYNNAYELGCIIKGMLFSADNRKIFCSSQLHDGPAELESILLYRDKKTFPENKVYDTIYDAFMKTVKTRYWINNSWNDNQDITSNDTLYVKKGEKISVTPAHVTRFYNGNTDTTYASGRLRRLSGTKPFTRQWEKTFVFEALPGTYLLEISCITPAGPAPGTTPGDYKRIIKVK